MRWLFVTLLTTAVLAAGQTPAPAQDDAAADAAGKALVNGVCSSCHGTDLITAKNASRADWQGVLDRMKGYGATVDDKQVAPFLDYLVKNYGPKQTPAADAGKMMLEGYCTSCHDLDVVTAITATPTEWQELVDRMNRKGADIPAKDIPVLVQYLAKTYPPKK